MSFPLKILHKICDIWLETPKIRKFQNLLVLACACWCSACACSCLHVNGRARAHAHSPKFRCWRVSFPFINSSQNRWYLARNAQHWKKWKCGILGILKPVLEGVIFLYKFFTKSVISGWIAQSWKIPEVDGACSCLLVLSLCLLMLARELPCPSPCSLPKIQVWEGVISLHKFFSKSVISGSKCPTLKSLEVWNSRDHKILSGQCKKQNETIK